MKTPPVDRRDFIRLAAQTCLGVSVASLTSRQLHAAIAPPSGKAKQVIYLFMNGAMSHLDTFDPKPGSDVQGDTDVISTSLPGVQFGSSLKQLANWADRLAVVRSLSTETGAHEQGRYLMRTSYSPLNSIRHPGLGAWMLQSGFTGNRDLPQNVLIGADNDHPMAGFLPPGMAPVPVGDPGKGLQNVQKPAYLSDRDFNARMSLATKFDRYFRAKYQSPEVEAYNQMYQDAIRLMGSEELEVFNISGEPERTREAYGSHTFGQGCLLARRLIEADVPFVEVNFGGWDMHNNLQERLAERAPQLDQGMGALLQDLQQRGLLDTTMVVLATEFGRTPKINENAGRDHHPGAFSCVLAGAGVRTGQVYGASDAKGFAVDEFAMTVPELNATIAAALGISTHDEVIAPNGRPFTIANGADPIDDLLA